MNAPDLVALIYRPSKGCRQYPFDSIDEVVKFVSRKPYSKEDLKVHAILNRVTVGIKVCPASEVVAFINQARGVQS